MIEKMRFKFIRSKPNQLPSCQNSNKIYLKGSPPAPLNVSINQGQVHRPASVEGKPGIHR